MSHWAQEYIGKPWRAGAVGPDEFDCWGFFRYVQRERYGVTVPEIGDVYAEDYRAVSQALQGHDERRNWTQVDRPEEGDAVLMARSRYPAHIGLWITANGTVGVLHCMQGAGVVFQSPAGLRMAGWGRLTYYRRAACTP